MFFLPKTLLYLRAGGRVSNLAFFGANLLKINPTIVLENRYLVSGEKYRGSFDLSLKKMINDFFKSNDIDPETVLIVGAPSVDDHYKDLISNLLREYGVQEARWMKTGAVISCHGGPGAIGIAGIEKTI